MRAIEGRALRKAYATDVAVVRALDGIDIAVEQGELVAVMGPSGCGKSTLLHMLGALDRPDDGEVQLGSTLLSTLSRKELAVLRRRHVGFVFQFFNLIPVLTVEENVVLPAALDGRDVDPSSLLERFGLAGRRHMLPAQLSGGEQQRTAIARALVNEPSIVLADEPTGNLDRASGSDVLALFSELHAQGQTIMIVTHDPAVASHAQRVVFMRDGKLVEEIGIDEAGDTPTVLAALARVEG